MEGKILDFSIQTNQGIISAGDGQRYAFDGKSWKDSSPPSRGMRVDFQAQDGQAIDIYKALSSGGGGLSLESGEKSKLVAALLAIFLGAFGAHKFYLGDTMTGGITLAISLGAGLITCGIATFVMTIISVIEGIIYLTKSDDDFERIYVEEKKSWF